MYSVSVKRLQIYIEEQADDELAARALQERTSKAALIRRFVSDGLGRARQIRDPLDDLPVYDLEPGDIDAVVYGA
jgi:hypothetical protein